LISGTLLSIDASFSLAQAEAPMPIRVETREVVVPVFVIDKSYYQQEKSRNGETTNIDQDYGREITGLTAKDFHVFEDGSEQHIEHIDVELPHKWGMQDNVSVHLERSFTPRGIWTWPDWPQQPQLPSHPQVAIRAYVNAPRRFY